MSAVVVCRNCGAKIRAGRKRCPRCQAALSGAPASPRFDLNRVAPIALALLVVAALITAYAQWRYATDITQVPVQATAVPVPTSVPAVRPPAPEAAPPVQEPPGVPYIEPNKAGGVAYGSGEFERALELYRDAVQRHPEDAESWSNLGQVFVRLNRAEEAIPAFLRAIELNADRWAYHFNLGRAYGVLSRWPEAVTAYHRAQQLYPEDYAIAFNLGLSLRKKGDLEPAIEQFKKAIALDPGDAGFQLALAMTYDQLGRKADALTAYQKTLELEPEAPEVPQIRARITALLN